MDSLTDRLKALSAGFQVHVAQPVEPAELALISAAVAQMARRYLLPRWVAGA